jgi:Xaa-Pro aminopeptidase
MASRISRLQASLAPSEALVLSSVSDIRYFTNFAFLVPSEREALLVVTQHSLHLLYASFSPISKQSEFAYYAGCFPHQLATVASEVCSREGVTKVLLDEDSLVLAEYKALGSIPSVSLVPLDRRRIWDFRMIKDESECAHLRHAGAHTHAAVTTVRSMLQPGMTEQDVAALLEHELRQRKCLPLAFPTIVAFGEHTALPHHQPTERPLKNEMPILIDVGGTTAGYAADMTRTFWFGDTPSLQFQTLKSAVTAAYQSAIAVVQHSTSSKPHSLLAKDVDHAARTHIEQAGFGSHFIHTTGHGLGLDIHEQPSLSSSNETVIAPGMAVTVEPGIYLENELGFRYENTCIVTTNGLEVTTCTPYSTSSKLSGTSGS